MDCWQLPAHSRIRLIILGIVFGGADTRQGFLDVRDLVRGQVEQAIDDSSISRSVARSPAASSASVCFAARSASFVSLALSVDLPSGIGMV